MITRLDVTKTNFFINKKLANQRSLNFSKNIMQRIGYLGVALAVITFLLIPTNDVLADDVDTKLQELQELQNQLKALLEEQETDDATPSNVMKLKVKEDRGIRGIEYVKIDLGIKEKARDRGVASVVYRPNLDPIATAKDLPQSLVTIIDPDNYLNHENLQLTWAPIDCFAGKGYCMEFTFGHEFLKAPEHDIIGLTVVDRSLNVSYSYFNDGIDVIGESLLPPETLTIVEQGKPPKFIDITQTDEKQDLWKDENDNTWTRNSIDEWIKLTPEKLQDLQNKYQKVLTRDNLIFKDMTEKEKIDAIRVFDSQTIQSQLPDSIETIFFVKLLRSENSVLQNELENESDKASEFLSRLYPGLRHNFD